MERARHRKIYSEEECGHVRDREKWRELDTGRYIVRRSVDT